VSRFKGSSSMPPAPWPRQTTRNAFMSFLKRKDEFVSWTDMCILTWNHSLSWCI